MSGPSSPPWQPNKSSHGGQIISVHPVIPTGGRNVDYVSFAKNTVVVSGALATGRLTEVTQYDTVPSPPPPIPPPTPPPPSNLGSPYATMWDYRWMPPTGMGIALLSQKNACDASARTVSVDWTVPPMYTDLLDENQAVLSSAVCTISADCSVTFAGSINNWTVTLVATANITNVPFKSDTQKVWGLRKRSWERCSDGCPWNWGVSTAAGGVTSLYKIAGNGPVMTSKLPLIDPVCVEPPPTPTP